MSCFDFRIINGKNGCQVIDRNLKTPYNALTARQMEEYITVSNQMAYMDSLKRREEWKKRKRGGILGRLASCLAMI